MFVCLGFGHCILFVYFFPWPQSSKGPRMGVNSLKTSIFPLPTTLRGSRLLLEIGFCRTVEICKAILRKMKEDNTYAGRETNH